MHPAPDNQQIILAAGNDLLVYDLNSLKSLSSLIGHTAQILDCAYSQDGNMIVTASRRRNNTFVGCRIH